jgi:small subunit ribosomal protein S15
MSSESPESAVNLPESKGAVIKKFARKGNDTGSPEVQVALLTKRIIELAGHFSAHKEDVGSRRGMLAMISRRKRLLQYLKENDVAKYRTTIESLGLRK